MHTITADKLTDLISRAFQAAGAPLAHADLVARSLVKANLAGHDSHGVIRTPQYLDAIASGMTVADAKPAVVQETGAVTMLDAQQAFGQVASKAAMALALDKAKSSGIAAVGIFNCNHIGRVGEWVELAAQEQMLGLAFVNGGTPGGLVAPYGGAVRRLGTNPIAAAIPQKGKSPIIIDFATSMVAEGKVRVARNAGKELPAGRILDKEGKPSTNPQDLYDGGMLLTAAEHKGYCLSLLMDFMGGILTGAGTAAIPRSARTNGVCFIVLNIEAFRPIMDFMGDGAELADVMRQTPPADGFDEVLLPGEPEERMAAERLRNGIPIDDNTWTQLTEAAEKVGISINL